MDTLLGPVRVSVPQSHVRRAPRQVEDPVEDVVQVLNVVGDVDHSLAAS